MDEEKLTEVALENGADDLQQIDSGGFEITCSPDQFSDLLTAFEEAGLNPELSEVTRLPQTTVEVDGADGVQGASIVGIAGRTRRHSERFNKLEDHRRSVQR
ncbi:MAG: YebC/PmpR family DNA-binding transcriptional regulator [Pirellulaceae bacterium]